MLRTILLTALVALGLAATPAAAQVVQGKVIEAGTGRPITAAEVVLQTDTGKVSTRAAKAVTDTLGAFRIVAPVEGEYTLQVRRIGYATHTTAAFRVVPGEALVLEIIMSTEVLQLDSLVVVERRRFPNPAVARFHERAEWVRKTGRGRIYYTDDLRRYATLDMLLKATNLTLHGRCMRILLDGLPAHPSVLDFFNDPEMVEGVEIYKRLDEIPAEYKDYSGDFEEDGTISGGDCAMVLVWTKPPTGPPSPLRSLIFGSVFATAFFLFTLW